MLVVNDRHNGEKHHQQCGKGERLFEGMTYLMLVYDTVKCRQ